MFLNDVQITKLALQGMIQPFISESVREVNGQKILSCGLSSYGYDIRLSSKCFYVFKDRSGREVNPKDFSAEAHLKEAPLCKDEFGEYFIIPGNSYGLGVALEKLSLPRNVIAIATGKSSYARCGIIANITPVEPGWSGHLTLEFSNASPSDVRIYANEGCVQLLFAAGEECQTSYEDRGGKYQGQKEEIVLSKV